MDDKTFRNGQFVLRQLMSKEVDQSCAFYGALFGWTIHDLAASEGRYLSIEQDGAFIGAILELPGDASLSSQWTSFVSVADTDAAVSTAAATGGAVLRQPADLAGIGRWALIADPTGAAVPILTSENGDGDVTVGLPIGTFYSETLCTNDMAQAAAFYRAVFGWESVPVGDAVMLAAGDVQVAGLEASQPGATSMWLTHVVVADLNAARAKAESLGAQVMERIDVADLGGMSLIIDPQGARLSLFEPIMVGQGA